MNTLNVDRLLTVDNLQIVPGTVAATAAPNGIQDSGMIAPLITVANVSSGLQVCFLGGLTIEH